LRSYETEEMVAATQAAVEAEEAMSTAEAEIERLKQALEVRRCNR